MSNEQGKYYEQMMREGIESKDAMKIHRAKQGLESNAQKLSYFQLEEELRRAKQTISFLERLNKDILAWSEANLRLQPPAPIIIEMSPEQQEYFKAWFEAQRGDRK